MSLLRTDRSWREEVRHRVPVRYLPQTTPDHLRGTWRDAKPARIEASLAAALRRPTYGWLVAAASAHVPAGRTLLRTVAGRAWSECDPAAGPRRGVHRGLGRRGCSASKDLARRALRG